MCSIVSDLAALWDDRCMDHQANARYFEGGCFENPLDPENSNALSLDKPVYMI
jgi:hypothetical protein